MVDQVKIHGLDDVRKALRALPKDIRKRELQKSLRKGADLIRDAARLRAPIGEETYTRNMRGTTFTHVKGTLADSIVVRAEKKKYLRDAAKVRIGVLTTNKKTGKAQINSAMAAAHEDAWYWRFIEFGTSKMPARPFLTPAFEMTKYIANETIKNALRIGVFKSANRVNKSRARITGRL